MKSAQALSWQVSDESATRSIWISASGNTDIPTYFMIVPGKIFVTDALLPSSKDDPCPKLFRRRG